jgi:hypothetical protein
VRIKGWTFLSASQYAAGLHDASAVDALFGEVEGQRVTVDRIDLAGHTPRGGAHDSPIPNAGTRAGGDDAATPSCAGKLKMSGSSKLVIFLGTNADFYLRQL